jgi:hypothetical protein
MDWLEILSQIFQVVIIPLLGTGTLYLVSLINTKKKELEQRIESEKAKEYLDMLEATITDCVLATTQTYVDALKAQGKFDLEAQKEALRKTYNAVLNILTEDAKEYLYKSVADLEGYILSKIEANVVTTKVYWG